MMLDTESRKKLLREFNFKDLFIEELGWDRYSKDFSIFVKDETFNLHAIAQKRGVQIFVCDPHVNGLIPEYSKRKQIEREITKIAHEHLIIYQNKDKTTQIWQWVSRKLGKAAAFREYRFERQQSYESLIQKLDTISFSLDEEEGLTLPCVTIRLKDALDKDKLTRNFYDRFEKDSKIFLNFIEGITQSKDKEWYSSVMLNRLMFIYFIQKKGLLDGDRDYLRNRLKIMQREHGKDKFYSFYRYFLLRLFHEGLGRQTRTTELEKILGKIPYLDGGLFQEHVIEQNYNSIQIPDEAFEKIFDFFGQYEWYLDDRPLRKGNEINPDVLGYIFEKFVNQKEMGAYYTKEDITDYISKNTIIPFLFDSVKKDCMIAFEWQQFIWNLVKENPDRYIYDAVKKGTSLDLPGNVASGIDDVSKRENWNKPAEDNYALATEIWRETIARRNHYFKLKEKIIRGEIQSINDFITYNLNLRQFVQDVIENAEGPELVGAFYKAITNLKILDPAVGSGAFLFAALNILEPLYEACLDRMQIFLDEADITSISKYSDFKKILEQVNKHPNSQYFIYKSIILNNLYGVDIMDEAVEICKLRLFLKLASEVNRTEQIESLPDIDFNIRSGNTLVGFINRDDVREAITAEHKIQKRLISDDDTEIMNRIEKCADDADLVFQKFKQLQTEHIVDEKKLSNVKKDLKEKLKLLEDETNQYLASEYNVNYSNLEVYQKWLKSYRPFHWFVDFYGVMKDGGFDVIIGNPPYIEYHKIKNDYQIISKIYLTYDCNNLYAYFCERALSIKTKDGRFGMILPNSSISADKMQSLQDLFKKQSTWISNYAWRPSKLFEGANMLLAIIISHKGADNHIYSTKYYKWYNEYRNSLFPNITYNDVTNFFKVGSIPKLPCKIYSDILNKIEKKSEKCKISDLFKNSKTKHVLYYFRAVLYWIKILDEMPVFEEDGIPTETGEMKPIYTDDESVRYFLISLFSSSLFFTYYITWSSCQVINNRDFDFPFDFQRLEKDILYNLVILGKQLQEEYKKNSKIMERNYSQRGREFTMKKQYFYIRESKTLIDQIDFLLAKHFSMTTEELDFIINYDIKYRIGPDSNFCELG